MRIALVLQRDFPTGGLQRDARALALALAARGHSVRMVAREATGEPPPGVERRLVPVASRSNHGRDLAFARRYRSAAADCDLIVGFDKLPGLDLYFAADDCWRHRAGGLRRLLPRGRVRLALEGAVFGPEGAPTILALTAAQRDRYARSWNTPLARFRLLPPLVDPQHRPAADGGRRAAQRAALGLGEDERLALFVGRDAQLKGLDRVLAALAPLRDAGPRLLAVGEIPPALKAEAARLGLGQRVIWHGGAESLAPLYAAADLLLHPARREAGGKVITEALAHGLPVFCTAHCGYAPLVGDHGAGALLAEPFAAAGLTALLAAADDPATWRRWRAGARRAAAALAQADAIAVMVRLIEQTGGHRTPLPRGPRRQGHALLEPAAQALFATGGDPMARLERLEGQLQRSGPRRETLEVSLGGERLFLKRHRGVAPGEILKNWLSLKQPVIGAGREWSALGRLAALGLPAAERLVFARRGWLPWRRHSCLLMRPLPPAVALEDWLKGGRRRTERARMAWQVGRFVARLHAAGIAHRDLYLCHLYRLEGGALAVLDLHRAIEARPLPARWQAKDLAALLFSARPLGLSAVETARFLAAYHGQPPQLAAARFAGLWRAVERRAAAIQAREARRPAG